MRIVHEEVRRDRALVESYARPGGATPALAKDILVMLERAVQRACARVHAEARADRHGQIRGDDLEDAPQALGLADVAGVGVEVTGEGVERGRHDVKSTVA